MKTPSIRRTAARDALFMTAIFLACGGEKATEPNPQASPPAGLRLVLPDTVTRGQAFSLTVTALDAVGQAQSGWSGTVSLSASGGTLSPATVAVAGGTATVQVAIAQYAGQITITSSVAGVSGSQSTFVLSEQPVARVIVVPATFMLPGVGTSQPLTTQAFDADGNLTAAGVTWESTRTGVVSVSASGVATALANGSSSIRARVGAIVSDPAVAYVTTPAANVMLVADQQITGSLTPVDVQAPYGPGWQYRVRVTGLSPQVGQLLAARGEKPLAGRVVSVQPASGGVDVTLELVPIAVLLPGLSVDETIPLQVPDASASRLRPRAPWALAEGGFNLGPFECKSALTQPNSNPFTMASVSRDVTPTLQAHIVRTNTRTRIVVQGGLTATARVNPTLTAAINGNIECKAEVGDIPIPLGGALAPFFGAKVPLGVGFELDGGVTLATMGLDIQVSGVATLSVGFDCNPECTYPFNVTGTMAGSVKPNLPSISSDFRVTAGVSAFAWADLKLGPPDFFPGSAALQLTLLEAKAGIKQDFNLASHDVQSLDAAYASTYSLAPYFSGGTTKDLNQLVNTTLTTLGVSLPTLTYSAPGTAVAESPRGTFQIVPASVVATSPSQPGDTATFIVDLSQTSYLTQYAVESVHLFRKPSANAALEAAPGACASIAPTSATQSLFTCKTDMPVSLAGVQTFYAFVKPILGVPLPVLLEVASDSKATVTVDSSRVFYANNFSTSAGAEWSNPVTRTSPSGERFLGHFTVADHFRDTVAVQLRLDSLPAAHTEVTIEFDLYIMGHWDGSAPTPGGPDIFTFRAGGAIVKRTTFANDNDDPQAFPGNHPGGSSPYGTGSISQNTLGYTDLSAGNYSDTIYRLRYTIPHVGPSILFEWSASVQCGMLTPGSIDHNCERFGLDNIRVTVR